MYLNCMYIIEGIYNMAIWVVEFSNGGYKIRKIFAFGYVDSYANIFLILNPPLENSTTRTVVMWNPIL